MDETAQQMLQNLLQAVESKMSEGTDQLLAEVKKTISEGKTALVANGSAADINGELKFDTERPNQENEVSEGDKELVLIQMFISQLLEGVSCLTAGMAMKLMSFIRMEINFFLH